MLDAGVKDNANLGLVIALVHHMSLSKAFRDESLHSHLDSESLQSIQP